MTSASERGARRHRRAVAYSPQDRERVRRGEPTLEEAEVERRRRLDALSDAQSRSSEALGEALGETSGAGESGNDARLLRDVPPHWG